MACPTCGVEPLEDARFCHACGSAVAQNPSVAEYKQVTVLFADVVHSMDIAARVGPERLREIMAALVDQTATVVKRYGGTLDKFTGDGIMALFGAPLALEDHALRACRAALDIQASIADLAGEVDRQDGADFALRIGLNSGQVIAGEIGTTATGYTAIGEQVGMAQRMESVATPGGAMLSESTARLVEQAAELGPPELVSIKGAAEPVCARRLIGLPHRNPNAGRRDAALIGRHWELSAIGGLFERAAAGQGTVVGLVGPPGIGKSRTVREARNLAALRGAEVFTAFCDSHTSQVPLYAATALLRAATGIEGMEPADARERIRAQASDAEAEDLVLFEDMLGLADPNKPLPAIDPEARRRRLTSAVKTAMLAREAPAVYVIEDAHWIDEVSEAMLADFLSVIPQTPSLVIITYRPEYQGVLSRLPGSQTIALAPLNEAETSTLVAALLGPDPGLADLGRLITERAAGNPFFAEEIVRELAGRRVLVGERGHYRAAPGLADVTVPATLQATIAARIDHLGVAAKKSLNAAAVIGSRFSLSMLKVLVPEPVLGPLTEAQLIDQVRFGGDDEYVFHHPLIRSVAYESQLKSDRAQRHRRLAETLAGAAPVRADENAALIAEHREAAGDLSEAYSWHMRAAELASNRDILAATASWERARQVADELPGEDATTLAMRIAPRAALCGQSWRRFHEDISGIFAELRDLCDRTGDAVSLAVALGGLAIERMLQGRVNETSRLASDCMEIVEKISDPTLTVGLGPTLCIAKMQAGEFGVALRLTQNIIDLADGDPTFGSIILGSPLSLGLAFRGTTRAVLGQQGWQEDLEHASAMSRGTDPITFSMVITYRYLMVTRGVTLADQSAIDEVRRALDIAEQSSEDIAVITVRLTLGLVLCHGDEDDRREGIAILTELRDTCVKERFALNILPYCDIYEARDKVARGNIEEAISQLRRAVQDTLANGNVGIYDLAALTLGETLLLRGTAADVAEAEAEVQRFASLPTDFVWVARDVCITRLRALIAQARGQDAVYHDYRDRFRALAGSLGFEGLVAQGAAMP